MWHSIQKLMARLDAEKDAALGIDAPEEQVTRRLPRKPSFSSSTNEHHAQVTAALGKEGELEEVRRDLEEVDERLRHLPSPRLLLVGVIVLGAAELLGTMLLLSGGLGLSGIELWVPSASLVAWLVWLTGRIVEAAPSAPDPEVRSSRLLQLFVALYILTVLALAVLRGASMDADVDGSTLLSLAFTAVLLFMAAGPSWLIESLWRQRKPAAALAGRRSALKAQERELAREVRRARAYIAKISDAAEDFEHAAEQIQAEYRHAHRLGRGAPPEAPPPVRRRKS